MILCALPFALLLDLAGMPWPVAVLSGFALAMSSTAVAVQELSSRSMMGQPVGQKAFSILLFQDLASIPLIAAIPVLALTMGSSDSNGAANPGAVDTLIRRRDRPYLHGGCRPIPHCALPPVHDP